MGEQKFRLRPPGYLDIDLTGDGHGHHIPGSPIVYHHGWKPVSGVSAGEKVAKAATDTVARKASHVTPAVEHVRLVPGQGRKRRIDLMGLDNPDTHRHLLNLSDEARTEIYKENGLLIAHPEIHEHELLERIKNEQDPKVKAELLADLKKRSEVLKLTLQAIERAAIDSKHEQTRAKFAKFDARLRHIKGGQAVIDMRDRLMNDHTLDKLTAGRLAGTKFAKTVGIKVATGAALGMIFGPLGVGLGVIGGTVLQEAFQHIVENVLFESSADVALGEHGIEKIYDKAVEKGYQAVKKVRERHRMRLADKAVRSERKAARKFREIHASDLSTPDARRSPAVSAAEFQTHAKRGAAKLAMLDKGSSEAAALHDSKKWSRIRINAWNATRKPWGGVTVDSHTGHQVPKGADAYALTVRDEGKTSVHVSPDATRAEFNAAMQKAREQFASELSRPGAHLGVFRDEDTGNIDIDPVLVTPRLSDVHDIGAYTHAVGGAYHFKSGDGYWPPHVKEK